MNPATQVLCMPVFYGEWIVRSIPKKDNFVKVEAVVRVDCQLTDLRNVQGLCVQSHPLHLFPSTSPLTPHTHTTRIYTSRRVHQIGCVVLLVLRPLVEPPTGRFASRTTLMMISVLRALLWLLCLPRCPTPKNSRTFMAFISSPPVWCCHCCASQHHGLWRTAL